MADEHVWGKPDIVGQASMDLSVPWTWDNEADDWWTPIILKGGLTMDKPSYIAWQNYLGVDKWYVGSTGSHFQIYDLEHSRFRIYFSAFSNDYMTGSSSGDHFFNSSDLVTRFQIIGDEDTVCIGPNEDTCLTRTSAGVMDFSKAAHGHDAGDVDLSVPWTWNNDADEEWNPIVLQGGKNSEVIVGIVFTNRSFNSDHVWALRKYGGNQEFSIYDSEWAIDRLRFYVGGHNEFAVGAQDKDHIFRDYDNGFSRFRILGDADTVCIGENEDTCLTRLSAGVLDFTDANHISVEPGGDFQKFLFDVIPNTGEIFIRL